MKRFRELIIHCTSHNDAVSFLHKVEAYCGNEPFIFSREVRNLYSPDENMTHILSSVSGTPKSVIVLFAREEVLRVINIVPYKHSASQIEKDDYNKIIEEFSKRIEPLLADGTLMEITPAEYTMSVIIPKSFQKLNAWVHCPAPQAPFLHQNDLHMWFDFLIALVENKEELLSGDLELWLREELKWDEDLIEETVLHFEHDIELLDYYERHRS